MKRSPETAPPAPSKRHGTATKIPLILALGLLLGLVLVTLVLIRPWLDGRHPTPSPLDTCPQYTCTYTIIASYPHDPQAFTQGLVIDDGRLYEGTGLRGQSTLREVDLQTGNVLRALSLSPEYFGEGVTVYDGRIIQLTWQSNLGFVYDEVSFQVETTFTYPSEGWGLTHDGTHLIMSDGTPTLHFLDPHAFEEVRRIEVLDGETPIARLNELEYVRGEILANVWQTDRIVRIDPQTGEVIGWIDLQGLLEGVEGAGSADVLNGIAYDAGANRLFVTGKLWPRLFEIALLPGPEESL